MIRTYEKAGARSAPARPLMPALRQHRSEVDTPTSIGPATLHFNVGVGHDFSRVQVHDKRSTTPWLAAEPQAPQRKSLEALPDEEDQDADPEYKRLQDKPDAGTGDAGTTPKAAAVPTLAASGDSYTDTATASHKKIRFDVTIPTGLTAGDYALVNKVKGSAKAGSGRFFKATLYGKRNVDINFADWQVDSPDVDPVYWSNDTTRWRYTPTTTGFFATDDPGPALSSETGAVYALNFKMGLYKLADVPTTTTGTISATAISEVAWQYSVVVDSSGKFTHPSI